MLNAHEIVAPAAHKVPEIISSSTPSESHSAIEMFTESNDKDSQAFPENVLLASNDNLEPSAVLMDAVYHSDSQPINDVRNRSDDYFSAESNPDLTSNVDPHHPVSLSWFPIECEKHVINRIALDKTWVYEDPTLFRGGGGAQSFQKSGGVVFRRELRMVTFEDYLLANVTCIFPIITDLIIFVSSYH
ncbi:unnamed protein product [Schistosoma rodhaini]|nr:unnamed protein product [Schistosoma rodhaini]